MFSIDMSIFKTFINSYLYYQFTLKSAYVGSLWTLLYIYEDKHSNKL